METAIWTRKNDRPHFHLRLIAWAMRRCHQQHGASKLAA